MTVYVDSAENAFGRMKMCHMLADTPEELFAMADKIGVARKWYQGFNKASCPHFDIAKSKRTLALANGAVVIERRELGALIKKIRGVASMAKLAGTKHGWEPSNYGDDTKTETSGNHETGNQEISENGGNPPVRLTCTFS